jgi:hypothetical protein
LHRQFLVAASMLLASVVPLSSVHAAQLDAQTVGNAYGDLVIFVLNVAAGNDGETQQPDGERQFKSALAEQFAADYASLDGDSQDALSTLALLDVQIRQAWPSLSTDQRIAARDQWASMVQDSVVAGAPCDMFDALARAQLLPSFGQYKQTNIDHLRQCWRDHPELTRDSQERDSGAHYGMAPSSTGSHDTYTAMFNANLYRYTASMNIASMGTATYSVKSFP